MGSSVKEMKTPEAIEKVLMNLPPSGDTLYTAMTYEQGIEIALQWVLGEVSDEEFEYTERQN